MMFEESFFKQMVSVALWLYYSVWMMFAPLNKPIQNLARIHFGGFYTLLHPIVKYQLTASTVRFPEKDFDFIPFPHFLVHIS